MRRFVLAVIGIGLVAIDRLTKIMFMNDPALGGSFGIPGIISITQHKNYGVVANIPIPISIIVVITLVALVAIAIALFHAVRRNIWPLAFGYTALAAGAVGNLWDRLTQGFVFDWLLLFGRSVVNGADAFVAIGLLIVIFHQPRAPKLDTDIDTR